MKAARSPLIAIVDDDEEMRTAMRRVLESSGFATASFDTAEALLESDTLKRVVCMVLDIGLPGMSGIELQKHLAAGGTSIPTVFVTGSPNRATIPCLLKPFPAQALLQAVDLSLNAEGA